jgi:hypothetical protein
MQFFDAKRRVMPICVRNYLKHSPVALQNGFPRLRATLSVMNVLLVVAEKWDIGPRILGKT